MGVPFNALLEALGRWLDEHPQEHLPDEVIELARQIDDEGRAR